MNKYGLKVLNYLLDKYERSVLSKQGSQMNIRIHVKIKKIYPRYEDSDYYQERILIDEGCYELNSLHIFHLLIDDEGIDDIELCLSDIQKAYRLAHRTYTPDCRIQIMDLLKQWTISYKWIDDFRNDMINKIEKYKGIHKYLDIYNKDEVKDIFSVLISLQQQDEEISFRKFSIKVLKDSKRLDSMKGKIVNIINDYYDIQFQDEEELFAHFNVMKNPGFIYLYGHMIIELNGQIIDIGRLNSPFSLTTENIKHLKIIDIQDHNLLTIENLTSFYDTVLDDTLIIYLGGYHNTLRRELLLKIYHFNQQLNFYHFGDIDAGGFYIFLHLKEKTNIPFQMLAMNKNVLEMYHEYTKKLTQNDRIRLEKIKEYIHDDVIDYMLENNCKLEQEIVDLSLIYK